MRDLEQDPRPAAGDAIDVFDMTAVLNEVTGIKIKNCEATQNFESIENLFNFNETHTSQSSSINLQEPQDPSSNQGKSQLEPYVTHRPVSGRRAP